VPLLARSTEGWRNGAFGEPLLNGYYSGQGPAADAGCQVRHGYCPHIFSGCRHARVRELAMHSAFAAPRRRRRARAPASLLVHSMDEGSAWPPAPRRHSGRARPTASSGHWRLNAKAANGITTGAKSMLGGP